MITVKLNRPRNEIPLKKDWGNRECIMPVHYKDFVEKSINFEVRPDDVFVVTMPKCGTTWMQEIAWLINNDFNFKAAEEKYIMERAPYLEWVSFPSFLNIKPNFLIKFKG